MSKDFWTEGPGSFAVAILIALTIRWAFLEAYVIPSGSMLPSLLINDHIFVNKFVYGLRVPFTEKWMFQFADPKRGEVVVFKYPEDPSLFFIKRVVGVPGDRVLYENGNLYINDELMVKRPPGVDTKGEFELLNDHAFPHEGANARENYEHWEEALGEFNHSILHRKGGHMNITYGPYTVPKDSFLVFGDNRDNSKDSRLWAEDKRFVTRSLLVGRASFVWLSCDEQIPVLNFFCNPATIRWSRFFHNID